MARHCDADEHRVGNTMRDVGRLNRANMSPVARASPTSPTKAWMLLTTWAYGVVGCIAP